MQEIFYEESARIQNEKAAANKYNLIKVFSILSYVIFGFWLFISFNFYGLTTVWFVDLLFILVPAVMFLSSGIILGKLKNKFYVEYDYTFVSGELRISQVIKNIKRKFILKFDVKTIEKLGFYGNETYLKYEKMPGISKKILTSNISATEGKDFYYIVVYVQNDKKLLVLECTEELIVNIIKFSNKAILDEQFSSELKNRKR